MENMDLMRQKKLTEKETMDSMDDWENCKGQCGHTRFCSQCMKERDRLIREKKQAMRKRMDELDNEGAANF